VTVFVDRGGPTAPDRFAFYSATLGSPAGTTTDGDFRFTCSIAVCKVSYGAAVISDQSGNAVVHPRLLINKDAFCEYVDGANNNAGLDQIQRVSTVQDAIAAMRTPLNMGIGGSLDCAAGQQTPPDEVVTEVAVRQGVYDVAATFTFGPSPDLSLPPGQ
jgi:hypothetical protein